MPISSARRFPNHRRRLHSLPELDLRIPGYGEKKLKRRIRGEGMAQIRRDRHVHSDALVQLAQGP